METLEAKDETAAVGLVGAADRRKLRPVENIADLGHREVTVDVDHLDPPAADEHFPARGRRLDEQSSHGAGAGLHEISASRHGRSLLKARAMRGTPRSPRCPRL